MTTAKSNAVLSSTVPSGKLVESDGTATRAFLKWLQNSGIIVNNTFNQQGDIVGPIAPGVVNTDDITDGAGSPLAGGKEAFLALVAGANGDVLTYDGTSYGPQAPPVTKIIAGTGITVSPPTGLGDVTVNATAVAGYSLGGVLTGANVALGSGAGAGATLVLVAGLDGNHQIKVTIGTAPVANGAVFTVTFTASRGHVTYPLIKCVAVDVGNPLLDLSPGSASSATTYTAFNTGIVAGMNYNWNISAP